MMDIANAQAGQTLIDLAEDIAIAEVSHRKLCGISGLELIPQGQAVVEEDA